MDVFTKIIPSFYLPSEFFGISKQFTSYPKKSLIK